MRTLTHAVTHVLACPPGLQVRKPQGNAPVDTPTSDENLEALSKYGIDLTANAAHLDPVIGR